METITAKDLNSIIQINKKYQEYKEFEKCRRETFDLVDFMVNGIQNNSKQGSSSFWKTCVKTEETVNLFNSVRVNLIDFGYKSCVDVSVIGGKECLSITVSL